MPISFADLQNAFLFVNLGAPSENEVYLDRRSGKFYYHSWYGDNEEELPGDIDDEKYIGIPHRNELDLTALVFGFVRQFLADGYDEVSRIFSRRGAYARYKAPLGRRGALDRWYEFENNAEEAALQEWCEEYRIELCD